MTWDVAPCCSPGKAVLVGDVSPSLYFGSFVLLCVTALAVSLALHTHICALVAGFRVPCLDCGVLVVSGRERWWRTRACMAAHISCEWSWGDCCEGDWLLPQGRGAAGSQQDDGLWLDTFASVCCPLAWGQLT